MMSSPSLRCEVWLPCVGVMTAKRRRGRTLITSSELQVGTEREAATAWVPSTDSGRRDLTSDEEDVGRCEGVA